MTEDNKKLIISKVINTLISLATAIVAIIFGSVK